jgi:WD40 repeat protein
MKLLLFLIAFVFASVTLTAPMQAQTDDAPYLYYYSRLLGGLIIERADGSDSRQIAADVIPPGMTGLAGPGWSPSGRYFAAFSVDYSDYSINRPYVIDTQGKLIFGWLELVGGTAFMEWSPYEENLLLIVGSYGFIGVGSMGTFFWLTNVETGEVLAEFGANIGTLAIRLSKIGWDSENQRIVFYINPETLTSDRYFRVTMNFDGTVLRERISVDEYAENYTMPEYVDAEDFYDAYDVSPSGDYEARGSLEALLTHLRSGERTPLPRHTQGTGCRAFTWSADEDYIITRDGTLRVGGGCGGAVLGVTDSSGGLWRELGGCSWDVPPCIGWLPAQVDVDALPTGAPLPVQLDPVWIEYDDINTSTGADWQANLNYRLFCETSEDVYVTNEEGGETLYRLVGIPCPLLTYTSYAETGIRMVVAHNDEYDLLATHAESGDLGVRIWQLREGEYVQILQLNSDGYALEFTDDGEYLREQNYTGWKVYSVESILARLT